MAIDNIRHFLYPLRRSVSKILIATLVLSVISFGLIHPRTVIFTGDYELLYDESWESSACVAPDTCYMHYRVTVGNTGHQVYQELELHFTGLPPSMRRWNTYTSELQATTRNITRADFRDIEGLSYVGMQINDLHPGSAVVIEFIDQAMPKEIARQLLDEDSHVQVLASGSVLEGNPRATAFARLLTFFM